MILNLTNIQEGFISSISATLSASLITWIVTNIIVPKIRKDQKTGTKTTSNTKLNYLNPFSLSLFITSFLIIITFFSLVYSWTKFNFVYLTLASVSLVVITYLIYNNQCPNCYKIFQKKLTTKDVLHEEKRPYQYRDYTIYLYTDGSEKDRKYHGEEKIKMETWRTEKEFYECQACGFKWDKLFERNLDVKNRPRPNIVRTRYNRPTGLEF